MFGARRTAARDELERAASILLVVGVLSTVATFLLTQPPAIASLAQPAVAALAITAFIGSARRASDQLW